MMLFQRPLGDFLIKDDSQNYLINNVVRLILYYLYTNYLNTPICLH